MIKIVFENEGIELNQKFFEIRKLSTLNSELQKRAFEIDYQSIMIRKYSVIQPKVVEDVDGWTEYDKF